MVTSLSSPFFLSLVGAFRLSTALLIIAVQNPVHALLLLIALFGLGSLLLLTLQREYFALLFLVVYVGAIVVLFLFVIRRLEIKRVNLSARFRDLLSPRALLLALVGSEILLVLSADSFDLAPIIAALPKSYRIGSGVLPLTERNQYTD
jgi:NADH:ubiquinone oxidoreductase subunit 6 (subunit J)